ncbi:MAG: L-rhamnose mutarotase, partial [Clostridia bacterium]|nr:L-rhamnose mutarotase [Clostridia bacterium]
MERHTFSIEVMPDKMDEFRNALGGVWEQIVAVLDSNAIKNFSLWNAQNIVFGYCEKADGFLLPEKDKTLISGWAKEFGDLFRFISSPFENMRLMYHDFGVIRQSKELIRHRVFITRLAPGKEEEYKRRHDALIEKRGGEITRGPDSNFSIWYAGGYIFGYNEIDTTMEKTPTDKDRENTVLWENKML